MKTITTLIAAAAVVGLGSFAYAESHADPIKVRQETMKTIGAQMKVLSDMAKGTTAFDAGAANTALTTMHEASLNIPTLFETEAVDPESDASDDIWTNWDDFVSKAEALQAASSQAEVTDADSLGQAVQSVGGACAACHKPYKL